MTEESKLAGEVATVATKEPESEQLSSKMKEMNIMAEESTPEQSAREASVTTEKSESKRLACKMKEISTALDNKIFQLPQKPVEIPGAKLIRKFEIGENEQPHKFMKHKVLMVMGATGAGKSTLINGMINYIFGVEWKDDFRFRLIVEKDARQTESVTNHITAYTIHPMEGSRIDYSFTIIDTPGFGDTRGMKRDEEIKKQVKAFFSLGGGKGIEHLDAVGFVTQSALVRLTPTQKYVINSILEIFGNDMAENILTLITFCDGRRPPVIEAVKEADIRCDVFFKFNNSALYTYASNDDDDFNEMFWKMGEKSFNKFFSEFNAKKSISIMLTKQVLENREVLEDLLARIQVQVETCLNKMDDLRQEEAVLQKYQAQINANKDFKYEITVPSFKVITVPSGTFATNCLTCKHTCHYPCETFDNDKKWKCKAMDRGGQKSAHCKRCIKRCPWQEHQSSSERYETIYKKETRSFDDLKRKFYEASKGQLSAAKLIESHATALEKAQTEMQILVEEARTCMELLKQIALKPNPLTQADYFQMMINSEKNQKKEGWHERVIHLEKAKQQSAWKDALIRYGCNDIDDCIEKEMENKERGWEERIKELEKMKRINSAVDNHKKNRREFFSRVSEGIREIGRGFKTILGK